MPHFISGRMVAVIENEWAQMRRNKVIMFTTFAPPFLFVALALTVLFLSSWIEANFTSIEKISVSLHGDLAHLPLMTRIDAVRASLLSPFLVLFEMLPIVVPLTVASYSIVGEKQSRSLETLLASPVRTWELLTAKALAAAIPGVGATWASFAVFLVAARLTVSPVIYNNLILSRTWLVAISVLTPLFTMFAVSMGIIISSRVRDSQSAQQLGSLIVLPLIGTMVAQVLGAVDVNSTVVYNAALVVGLLDVALLFLAVRLFRRERILVGWK